MIMTDAFFVMYLTGAYIPQKWIFARLRSVKNVQNAIVSWFNPYPISRLDKVRTVGMNPPEIIMS